MTAAELKTAALRTLRIPPHQRADVEAAMDRLLQPYMERDARVAANNKDTGSRVLPFDFKPAYVTWLANAVRRDLSL